MPRVIIQRGNKWMDLQYLRAPGRQQQTRAHTIAKLQVQGLRNVHGQQFVTAAVDIDLVL